MDQFVRVRRRAETVPPDPRRAVVPVEFNVVERSGVHRPNDVAGCAGDFVGEVFSGREVSDVDRKILRALAVGAPREEPMVGRGFGVTEVEEWKILALPVAIEEDFLGTPVARLAA